MAESVVSTVLHKIGSLAIEEAKYLQGVPAKVQTMKHELEQMQCFLEDADAKMGKDKRVKKLVSKVRELAYEAEDAVEEANSLSKLNLIGLRGVGKKIDQIIDGIRTTIELFGRYNIVSVGTSETQRDIIANPLIDAKRLIHPDFDDEVDIVGFDKEISEIKEELIDVQNKDLTVISIVGPGGAGKSTLARKVYNSLPKEHFNARVWISVSQRYALPELLKIIAEEVLGKEAAKELVNMSEQQVKLKVRNSLKRNKYLIILDDIWKPEDWDAVNLIFPDVQNGSRIVLTTRSFAVSNHPKRRKSTHEPKLLDEEQSINLFYKKAFPSYIVDDTTELAEFKELGKALALKGNGLPLAITVLGGFLSKHLDNIDQWKKAIDCVDWKTMSDEEDIYGVLDLSYNSMPSKYRSCFLYCTSFPEDYIISVDRLTDLWIAEGFVPHVREHKQQKETALMYVQELVQRCLVLVEEKYGGQIGTIKVHDVLRDWGIHKARSEGFFKDCSSFADVEKQYEDEIKAYRMVFHGSVNFGSSTSKKNTRTLLSFDAESDWDLLFSFQDLESLRMLFLRCERSFWINKNISKMRFLRYLGLQGASYIKVPSSIKGLMNLVTLDARDGWILSLPDSLWSIPTLRHVWVGVLDEWSPPTIGPRSNLETFVVMEVINLSKEHMKWVLQRISVEEGNHQHLSWFITVHGDGKMFGRCTKMIAVRKMEILRLWLRENRGHPVRLHCPHLLNDDSMGLLESNEDIKALEINGRSYTGKRMTFSSHGFPELKFLKLHDLDVEELVVEDGSMPILEELKISKCTKLTALPKKGLFRLRELVLIAMPHQLISQEHMLLEELQEKGVKVDISEEEAN